MADLSKIVCLEQDCRHGTEQTGSSGSGNDTYTKAEIDSKDADIRAAASEAKSAANNAQNVNQTQDGQIKALQEAVDNLHNYEHPTHKANSKGFYKFASDDLGHVSETEAVTKKDIVGLGIPGSNTTYTLKRNGNRSVLEGSDGSKTVAITSDYVTHGYENSSDVKPYRCYLIFYHRKPDDDNEMIPFLASSEEIWVNEDHSGIGVKGTITAGNFSGANATTEEQGLMSPEDKKKLDGIADGANKIIVDSALSDTSTNPVQSKAVKTALDGKAASGHTHAMITNSALLIAGANNAEKWVCLGTLVSGGDARSAIIRVWSGNGYNAGAYQNASFEIQIKDGYQSTHSAAKACGVTAYRINCSTVKVKVIPTAHNTYTVWVYLPWKYWNGNYAVYGRYTSWTYDGSNQTAEPEGTGSDTAYYDQAFLTSTVAKSTEATALTETAWTAVPTTGASATVYNSLKYLKSGNTVYVQGAIGFNAGLNVPTCGTMPSACLPDIELCFTGWDYASGAPAAYPIKLGKDGVITLLNPTSTAYWFKAGRLYHFNFCYHIG